MKIKPFTTYTGTVVPLFHDNIDTDQIIPKVHLKRISKSGFGPFLFDEWRYLKNGQDNPEFILNQAPYNKATILVTGDNFGCGSSREHAAWALKDYGFQVIIAKSFSDIFYMNCTKNALLPIRLDDDTRQKIVAAKKITIDLPRQRIIVKDDIVTFDIEERWKHKFINGLDDIGMTLAFEKEIEAYERGKLKE
ncbi:3-isopropylmalate dehydratase small subunit [Staphylococcus hyicus]|uniref:3-isopropylmalate dehydratase small subunit n=2 Tax=Staphylococcus hyicus TaxID=1284 RepID=A0ACD5FQF0_STAHY|nr:3-isopropylmalate dehydratase small subunit [Staphylococcus hyicus]AJC95587.1 isopropylmalate isomerase [Staphylococcus hyicus]MDP4449370.1 3-isopropylmalate dehydratase small subunit [Staphylococcus hyicus]MDP4461984.1 3-isopropylmalate dehydratase small subunit [Staphylococcus hyicus]MDP4463895.1 3-isopropylmalate dehydratase small subunit [Staphylococcus hyicus]MDP4469567.1 3-isopropylmalate dehydratase small subunit [Staphylococcus hyicus]